MRILLAANDIGGSRAIAPLATTIQADGHESIVLARGYLSSECSVGSQIVPPELHDLNSCASFLDKNNIDAVIFGSNLHDILPLRLARAAMMNGSASVHVLDSWTAYSYRVSMDGLPMFVPHLYTAIDSTARMGAIADGIPAESISITGHPDFSLLATEWSEFKNEVNKSLLMRRLGMDPARPVCLYVNEPVVTDQGRAPVGKRGYDEDVVQALISDAYKLINDEPYLIFIPHPRDLVPDVWYESSLSGLPNAFLFKGDSRQMLLIADMVIGMCSVFLYQAWLLSIPVMSLQPNLKDPSMRYLQRRDGIYFIDGSNERDTVLNISKWLIEKEGYKHSIQLRSDLQLHMSSASLIMKNLYDRIDG